MENLLNEYPIQVQINVAWGEMDAFQHVNNLTYFRYFENARIKYLEALEMPKRAQKSGVGVVVAETSCRFRKPLFYPDDVIVGVKVQEILEFGFIHQYCLVSKKLNKIAAEGMAKLITYNYIDKHKVALPDEVLMKIEGLENKTF